jgi:hypothetical protein
MHHKTAAHHTREMAAGEAAHRLLALAISKDKLKDDVTGECCAVLCCAVLCCAVLCCAVLCCAALRCTALELVLVLALGPAFCAFPCLGTAAARRQSTG